MATFLNVSVYDDESMFLGVMLSNWCCYAFFFLAIILPIWIIIFFGLSIRKWEDKKFKKKYGSVLEGMRLEYSEKEQGKMWIAIVFPVLMLVRRIGFVYTVVFQPWFTWLQLAVTFLFIQVAWNYLVYFYPMEDVLSNRLEIFAELTNLMLMYHVMLFTDFVLEPELRYKIGWSFIFCTGIFISTHMFLMIKNLVNQV